MQASAAYQTNSPANNPASQAKPDANRADAASPFALLMQATARDSAKLDKRDTKESGDKSVDDKIVAGKNDAKQNDAGPNGIKRDDGKRDDGKRDTAPAQTASLEKSPTPGKAEKQEKEKDKAAVETGPDAGGGDQLTAVLQQSPDPQPLPPASIMQVSVAIPADTGANTEATAQEDIGIDGATAKAPAPIVDLPPSDPVDPAAKSQTDTAVQPQIAAQPGEADDSQASEAVPAQSAAAPAAPAEANPPVAAKDTVKPAAVRAAARNDSTAAAKSDIAGIGATHHEPAQAGTSDDEPVQGPQAKPAGTDIAKDDSIGTAPPKDHAAHESAANYVKTDSAASESQKADAPRADTHPVEADNAPAQPKHAPQSASVSNAAFAINTIAAPQAAQHAQAPTATQHVQVTAQPAPNLPALAVEISAKSQSGAKQFDIRLDPPELGRVEVRLSIDATGKASAHLSADQPQTLSLLQKDAPILTRALREAGLDVSQDGLNFSLRQQTHGQQGNDGNNGRFGSARNFTLAAAASIDPVAAGFAYRGLADGRVDIRV